LVSISMESPNSCVDRILPGRANDKKVSAYRLKRSYTQALMFPRKDWRMRSNPQIAPGVCLGAQEEAAPSDFWDSLIISD
jgi:hypothetical protein